MAVSANVLKRARKLNPEAIRTLLTDRYPAVHRLAHGLSGRADVGHGVVRSVMAQSIRVMPKWKTEVQAEHWFNRHTILATRRAGRDNPPDPHADLLLEDGKLVDAAYTAFVRALRALPHQQQEAFLLYHGERLNPRLMAVSMDCSTEAAENHLRAAQDRLRPIAAEQFEPFANRIASAYAHLSPSQELVLPGVKSLIRTRVWPRRIARWIAWVVLLGGLALAGWAGWTIYPMIEV